MAKSEFTLAFNEIIETHHLPRDIVAEALRQALISAYRRDSTVSSAQRIEAEVDLTTNRHRILVEKEVVDDVVTESTEVSLEKARYFDPNIQLGDMLMVPQEVNIQSFGRIAAQTAKQVILQKIREAERKALYEEYKDREGDLVTGTVQSVNGQNITLSLGRTEAVMPRSQQIQGERYRPHDKVRTLVLEVKESSRDPQIVVTRAHKNMLRRLLEYEVPEIYNGQVEIKNIAREPGHRSKVAVVALQPGIDPVGACVGMRGMRIQNIVKELNDEKIDVIEWNADPSIYIAKALSPARVTGVYLEDDLDQGQTALVIVPDDQLSLAIGREGQNARLAAKLTGWRIDIKSTTEAAFTAMDHLNQPPLSVLAEEQPDLITEMRRILDKKKAERAVMPEEYQTLSRFVQLAEQRQLEVRQQSRAQRLKAMDKVRPSVPAQAFKMPIEELELAPDIVNALKAVPNVGELMVRLQADEDNLRVALKAAKAGDDAMDAIHEAIDSLVLPPAAIEPPVAEVEVAAEAVASASQPVAEPAMSAAATDTVLEASAVPAASAVAGVVGSAGEDEEAPPAFIDEAPRPELRPEEVKKPKFVRVPRPESVPVTADILPEPNDEDEDKGDRSGKKKDKKGKNRRRELVFDERRGEVVSKRKRKGGRDRGWSDQEDE
ncbi:MAG TPA: transcription termination factor NusA [Aggregatilineales bacterium]|nr:transcription termination factor NusA [Aggregatilineales bacterium]